MNGVSKTRTPQDAHSTVSDWLQDYFGSGCGRISNSNPVASTVESFRGDHRTSLRLAKAPQVPKLRLMI